MLKNFSGMGEIFFEMGSNQVGKFVYVQHITLVWGIRDCTDGDSNAPLVL